MIDFAEWRKTWNGKTASLLAAIDECGQSHPRKECVDAWNSSAGRMRPVPPSTKTKGGPGTELKKLLSSLGIKPSSCNCNSKAALMDRWGPEVCEAKLDIIAAWLVEQAAQRRWLLRNTPFLPSAARMLVRFAIRRART